ncbi:TetR/AcrR family transcriptional regulator [Symbiopectobacterium purcellii]|uniref:TetR/AcrR family transcriptional regulator n=1 Tax=Symbiopectobacterium purcellii TaxID=2871826 RepID=A0ABX9AGX0_9ENTR|nr:TetR/AcrR family transcriptional regulator [Symbiopectobacterium purcellii]QZN94399.1 TetR/AcrR family transcriptional regulator [Symbiopectobacterium purcellii]
MQEKMNKEERTEYRRNQIIAAARICFRRSGFHGAGMTEIAKHAELSVGQIYRYFTNKDAVIEAIVRDITHQKLQFMLLGASHVHPAAMAAKALSLRKPPDLTPRMEEDHALMLEVTAEATRNPRVAEILQEADSRLFPQACTLMARDFPHFTPEQIAARVEVMATLCEGTAFRSVLQTPASPELLHHLYQQLLQLTFSDNENDE